MLKVCPVPVLGALVLSFVGGPAFADDCTRLSSPTDVVRCAVEHSTDVASAKQELRAIAGRRVAAGIWLPGNPLLAVSVGSRRASATTGDGTVRAINWYVTLSQEIEIAGQRWARVDAVDAEAAAQIRRISVAEREVEAEALSAYFEALAARDSVGLAIETAELAAALTEFARARLEAKLISVVDADLLVAEASRLGILRFEAERRFGAASARLATLVGIEPTRPLQISGTLGVATPVVAGSLEQLVERALTLRGEVAASEQERQALVRRLSVYRRGRAPNLTLSANIQNDGFNERVYSGGVALPIPLPAPVGRTFAGEIAETRALIDKAALTTEGTRRRVRLEVADAWAAVRAREGMLALFPSGFGERARTDLSALKDALSSRQISVREALFAQRSLIDAVLNQIESQRALAAGSVELMRAAGIPYEGVTP